MSAETRKDVVVTLHLVFEGDYYDARECVGAAEDWIRAGLEDRDDLREVYLIAGKVLRETEVTDDGR